MSTQDHAQPIEPLTPDDLPAPEASAPPEHISELDHIRQQLEATKDQMIRAMAETENTRKRAQKEREDTAKYAVSRFAKDLLEISDNLRRALDAVPTDLLEQEPRIKNLVDGIEATERTMLRAFEKHGITKLLPLNEIFNPNYHEVMFETPLPGKPAGTIIQILEAGYMLHDRLLRPARVGVVKDDGYQTGAQTSGGHLDTQA